MFKYQEWPVAAKIAFGSLIVAVLGFLFGTGVAKEWFKKDTTRTIPENNPYSDVAGDTYYYMPALWAYYHDPQIIGPTGDNFFSPHLDCTRDQILTFLWKANGAPKPKQSNNPFSDVKEGAYYYQAVLWALETSVITDDVINRSGGKLGVGELCTRSDALYFVWNAQGRPKPNSTDNPYPTEVNEGAYYYQAVLWAEENEFINSTSKKEKKFQPSRACDRAMIAWMLYKNYSE